MLRIINEDMLDSIKKGKYELKKVVFALSVGALSLSVSGCKDATKNNTNNVPSIVYTTEATTEVETLPPLTRTKDEYVYLSESVKNPFDGLDNAKLDEYKNSMVQEDGKYTFNESNIPSEYMDAVYIELMKDKYGYEFDTDMAKYLFTYNRTIENISSENATNEDIDNIEKIYSEGREVYNKYFLRDVLGKDIDLDNYDLNVHSSGKVFYIHDLEIQNAGYSDEDYTIRIDVLPNEVTSNYMKMMYDFNFRSQIGYNGLIYKDSPIISLGADELELDYEKSKKPARIETIKGNMEASIKQLLKVEEYKKNNNKVYTK